MPSEFNPTPRCQYCELGAHRCGGCRAPIDHNDCREGRRIGICDDCAPLMQARP